MTLAGTDDVYLRAAASAALLGTPFVPFVDAVRQKAADEAAAKIIDLAAMRTKLRATPNPKDDTHA